MSSAGKIDWHSSWSDSGFEGAEVSATQTCSGMQVVSLALWVSDGLDATRLTVEMPVDKANDLSRLLDGAIKQASEPAEEPASDNGAKLTAAESAFLARLGQLEWKDADFEPEELPMVYRLRALGFIGGGGNIAETGGHRRWRVRTEYQPGATVKASE